MEKRLEGGFSILEVLIALLIFGIFAGSIIFRLGNNVTGSIQMAEDISLHNLAELKMNEVLISQKEFTNATENDVDTGNFDIEGYKQFKYKVEIKKNEFPNFSQLTGTEEEDQQESSALQKLIFEKLKKNMEILVWQVKVTVTNTDTNYSYELNSWIENTGGKIDTNFNF